MKKIVFVFFVLLMSCAKNDHPKEFSDKALQDTVVALNGETVLFNEIIKKHKGKKIVLDIWASWCGDCIKGMPKVVKLQEAHKDVVFLFFSLDKNDEEWKAGIKKYNVRGTHYLLTSGWKGSLGTFLNLDWIPRYLVIDEKGEIVLFKAVHADANEVLEALKK